jgi:F-type H+-transporting ATPase subunit gamma
MPTIKELRLRIKSLQNTSKITSAMKMVSASRLRKAQDAFNRNKPYAQKIQELMDQITASFQDLDHPLMKVREVKKVRYYVLASDRGLAGSFNNNLIKYFVKTLDRTKEFQGLGLGRRARDFINRNNLSGGKKAELQNTPSFANASEIANAAIKDYISGEVDQVVFIYNHFKSALSQVPTHVQLLPFAKPAAKSAAKAGKADHGAKAESKGYRLDYIVEPNPAEVFNELLPQIVTLQVYKSLLENAVGEHTARMTAMDSATKNTKELIGSLTLKMNRARQAAITKELIEIVSGAEALKG